MANLENEKKRLDEINEKTNQYIDELGVNTKSLYDALEHIQKQFDVIRHMPSKDKLKYQKLKKIRLDWKQHVDYIADNFNKAEKVRSASGVAGVAAGMSVAALGPTAAMGIATTFGVASTGTAISTLTGAAATNAALAWLGGGALAVGGGGMAAGEGLLTLAGPVGWLIAAGFAVGAGFAWHKAKEDREKLEKIFCLICERDQKKYQAANAELKARINRIKSETPKLVDASSMIDHFGTDYQKMTEHQQYALGSYVNFMNSSTALLTNPILGLKPNYQESDYDKYCRAQSVRLSFHAYSGNARKLRIDLANLLYGIPLDNEDKELFIKSLKKNKEYLQNYQMTQDDLSMKVMDDVQELLEFKKFH